MKSKMVLPCRRSLLEIFCPSCESRDAPLGWADLKEAGECFCLPELAKDDSSILKVIAVGSVALQTVCLG
jgi:hypothetical protein